MTHEPKNVAIIGAGIVGISTAIWLQRAGHKVTLIDPEPPGSQTSFGNAGVLASGSVLPVTVPGLPMKAPGMALSGDSPLFLRWRYLPRMIPWLIKYLSHARPAENRRIAAALHHIIGDCVEQHKAVSEGTGVEDLIEISDFVQAYADRSVYEAEAFSWDVRSNLGIPWTEMTGDQYRAYDPAFQGGFGFAAAIGGCGHVRDPGRYVSGLAAHVEKSGGAIRKARALDVIFRDGSLAAVATDAGQIDCDTVVVTAGVWSGGLLARLGLKLPVEAERGYHIEFVDPSIQPRSPTTIVANKFVMTPMDGRLRCAGLVEFAGIEAPASDRPIEYLKRNALRVLPGLKYSEMRDWMGRRPALSDSIPVIGALADRPGVYAGFGHHHVGLTGGPKTGRLLASMIDGATPNIDMGLYAPERFA